MDEAPINLTPLIDVVFVILIMFIVLAPLLDLDRIELAEGGKHAEETSATRQENSPILLHVYSDNTIKLNQRAVTLEELKTALVVAKKITPEAIPQIFHDKKATFGTYQAIKNLIEEAGFSQMDVLLR